MDVRHATAADAAALAHLMAELGYPTSPEEMAARMEAIRGRADHATFVAEEGGVVAGMVGVTVSPSLYRSDLLGAIVALVVSSEFRGRGIAALLVDRGEQWLRHRGAKRATVNPSTHRQDAHRLYARLGYEHTGLRFSKALG
ncbi:GNAT family N-acetyltransferase [Inquilinus limosus]|uniref:GNAT family N-acetyltransferase n=1 Tax=Inquilinus limosus TaxID=171674 RepID=UPI003F135D5A